MGKRSFILARPVETINCATFILNMTRPSRYWPKAIVRNSMRDMLNKTKHRMLSLRICKNYALFIWENTQKSVIIIAILQSFKQIQHLKPEKRVYCRTCDKFVINPKDRANHNGHDLAENIEDAMLENPIQGILNPVELNAKNAVNFKFAQSSDQRYKS